MATGRDVLIIGGGIIGVACAFELSRRGASVTLLERAELAAGASGRNLGLVDPPKDPVLDPLARASVQIYLEVTADPPLPVFFDREPIGILAVGIDGQEAAMVREEAAAFQRAGIGAERLEEAAIRELEPELTPEIAEAWLFHEGRRVDPAALTGALAELARSNGAAIRHHLPARRLLVRGDAVVGAATDEGPLLADAVVLAAGPWSAPMLRPLGLRLPVTGARGWLIHLGPPRPLVSHWIEGAARTIWRSEVEPVSAREFAEGVERPDVGSLIQPSPDGTIVAGTSREAVLAPDPHGLDVPRAVASAAIRLVPALADAPVLATWSGVRPMSPDEHPLIGWVLPGLLVAAGHGSEGVILGGGTAQLVASMVGDDAAPFDPAPFDPLRFSRR